ncbi:Acyl-CoA reductase (LuxC) [Sphingobium faniae]|nr:Acyl-CoA reductase (LuxC) [Sphingobium faniae]
MTELLKVPFFVKGELVETMEVEHRSRDTGSGFITPRLELDALVWPRTAPPPAADVSTAEIIDLLVETGRAMDLDRNVHMRKARDHSVAVNTLGRRVTENQLRAQGHFLQREFLEFLVEQQLGAQALDGWKLVPGVGGAVSLVRAFPSRIVNILAGNGAGGAPHVARAALTKGVNLMKMASSNPFTLTAILQTMAEVAPGHPTVRSFSAVYWRGGDEAVERFIFQPQFFEKIVAWGGEAAIRHVTRYLGPGLELIALDPKQSCSFIGREAFADEATLRVVAGLAATDVNVSHQGACLSSRFQFIEASEEEADHYCELLLQELGRDRFMGNGIGPAPLPDLAEQVNSLRPLEPLFRVWGEADGGGLVIRSDEPVDFYPDRKTVNVVPVRNLADAVRFTNIATQTAGIYPDGRKAELRDALAASGVQRVVPLGLAMGGPSTPHDGMYQMHRMVKWVVDEGRPPEGVVNGPYPDMQVREQA